MSKFDELLREYNKERYNWQHDLCDTVEPYRKAQLALQERDRELVDALKHVHDATQYMSDPYSRNITMIAYNVLKELGELE